jgi:DNA polymerase elongation subunit (family B)
MLRFAHIQDIQMAGWSTIEPKKFYELKQKKHYVSNEYFVNLWRDIKSSDKQSIAPLIQASFDIETYSHDGGFPDPKDKGCPVIQIATTLQKFGENKPYKRSLLSLGTCDPKPLISIENIELQCFETEAELLNAWGKLVRNEDIDILIGYNIWGFDLWYLHVRATMCDAVDFFELGRVINKESTLKAASFSSGAYGDSDYQMVDTLGRFQIDLLVIMKREHKLTSYSLNAVSEHFLKDKKVDMPYKLMFEKYKGTNEDRAEIAVYCVKDTDLPLALINKLAIVPNMIEMSKATWVPMSYLIERGQGIKVFSQILYQTRHENMLVVTLNRDGAIEQEPYEGATVLQALKGAYMDTPITGLDFASLYPTIMRAHKLCHSTYVNNNDYDNIEGVEYITVDGHRFAQNSEGILPKMLRTLATNRKQAKKDMAKAENDGNKFMKAVYNGKQLAFKVSMNSIYGFCGALVGFLPCKPVASCTTSIGRKMIEQTKNLVEEWYPGATVVYGDSVSGDTPLLLRHKGLVVIRTIESLTDNYTSTGNKEYGVTDGSLEVWSDKGWTNIKNIIRHKTTKKMYKVCTSCGSVDVTEDHSLLDNNATEISPVNIQLGKKLLHTIPSIGSFREEAKMDQSKASLFGYIYFYGINHGDCITFCDAYLFDNIISVGKKAYTDFVYHVSQEILSIHIAKMHHFIQFTQSIPEMMFNVDFIARCSFIKCIPLDFKMKYTNKLDAMKCYTILRSAVRTCYVSYDDKNMCYFIHSNKNVLHNDEYCVNNIIQYESSDYVYDLTTENHHFQAGVGSMIVHNTDSVMVRFDTGKDRGQKALERSFELGVEAADKISATFKAPIELEFEKVYWPYLLFSKKRYAGLMYTKPEKSDYIDAKGIQLVRRDNCPFVKRVSQNVLDTIMYKMDTQGAIKIVQAAAKDLLAYKIKCEDLVVSKSLRRISYVKRKAEIPSGKFYVECNGFYLVHEYKNANLPHLVVSAKHEERESGSGPKSGDRVPYVFIDTGNPKDLQYTKAEDPEYVKANNLKLDVIYYLEHALQSPLESLFELFLENPKETLFSEAMGEFKNQKNKSVDIYEFLGI